MQLRSSKIVTYIPQGRSTNPYNNDNAFLLYCVSVIYMMCFFIFSSIVIFIFYIVL